MQVVENNMVVQVASQLGTNAHSPVFVCGRCNMLYHDYRQLLEHLYWRHGTESRSCKECELKQWTYAAHICNILPIFIELGESDDEEEYCICGRQVDSPMIGCDGPKCAVQWYHFTCVGIDNPPDGDWLCPVCSKKKDQSFQESEKT